MPGTINYTGDQAQVLPDNTAAMLHFSQQFAELDREKRLQQQQQQKQDLERQKYISTQTSKLHGPEFQANSTYQPLIDKGITDATNQAFQMYHSGATLADVSNYIDNAATDIRNKAANVKALDANIAASTAALAKQYPNIDQAALISFARHDASFDQNGNLIDPLKLDPTQDFTGQAYKNHYADLFPVGSGDADLSTRLDKKKLADVGAPTIISKNGDIKQTGYDTKIPDFAKVITGADGKPVVQAISQNYRMPGAKTDYVDNTGQNVKIAPDNVYNEYYNGALGANIERQVREALKTPVQTNQGPVTMGMDSEYANMLRKKLLYEQLNNSTSRYPVVPDKNAPLHSLNQKNAVWGRQLQEEGLKLKKDADNRADQKWSWEQWKESNKEAKDTPVPLIDYYNANKKQTYDNPFGPAQDYVKVSDIQPDDLQKITGNRYLSDGTPDPANITKNVEPYTMHDGSKIYIVNNGHWYGEGGKQVDEEAAYKRQIEPLEKAREKIAEKESADKKPAAKKPNMIQRTVTRIKNTFKGTDKPLYDLNSQ